MSKNWYPMINYEKCVECGICVNHCTHGVYNEEEAPRPVVINPENCVEGCTGCGSKCPEEAIIYFGNDNGVTGSGCCCGDSDDHDDCSSESESGCGCKGGGCCGG